MEVHEVVDNATLKVVLNAIDDDLLADIHDLEVGVFVLIAVGVDGLVDLFVVSDPVTEVLGSGLGILAAVVGTGGLDVADVGHYEVLVVALALDEEDLDAVGGEGIGDPFATLLGRVGRIEDADDATGAEPGQHVRDGGLGSGTALPLALLVVRVEEIGCGMGCIIAPIVADVERLGWDGEPLKVALRCGRKCQYLWWKKKKVEPRGSSKRDKKKSCEKREKHKRRERKEKRERKKKNRKGKNRRIEYRIELKNQVLKQMHAGWIRHTSLCNVALPARREADHDDTYLGVLDLDTHAISTPRRHGGFLLLRRAPADEVFVR